MEFDCSGRNNIRKLREAHRSFIDSVVLEVALPNSEYPPYILMSLLHDAVEECRKEEKRFSQALWDAIGDFSVCIYRVLMSPIVWTHYRCTFLIGDCSSNGYFRRATSWK
jgi:hypothetical protein